MFKNSIATGSACYIGVRMFSNTAVYEGAVISSYAAGPGHRWGALSRNSGAGEQSVSIMTNISM